MIADTKNDDRLVHQAFAGRLRDRLG